MLPKLQNQHAAAVALVIDDEGAVRALLRRMLAPELCQVLEAADGESGLRAIERSDPPVDIVLTDYIMPGLDGLDVLEVLAENRPTLPVAIVSAHAGSIYMVQRRLGGQPRVLQKPFSEEAVKALTLELITQARSARQEAELQRMHLLQRDLVSAAWALHHSRHPGG